MGEPVGTTIWIYAPSVPISTETAEVVTPEVYAVPLPCVPLGVSENLNWWFAELTTL